MNITVSLLIGSLAGRSHNNVRSCIIVVKPREPTLNERSEIPECSFTVAHVGYYTR